MAAHASEGRVVHRGPFGIQFKADIETDQFPEVSYVEVENNLVLVGRRDNPYAASIMEGPTGWRFFHEEEEILFDRTAITAILAADGSMIWFDPDSR